MRAARYFGYFIFFIGLSFLFEALEPGFVGFTREFLDGMLNAPDIFPGVLLTTAFVAASEATLARWQVENGLARLDDAERMREELRRNRLLSAQKDDKMLATLENDPLLQKCGNRAISSFWEEYKAEVGHIRFAGEQASLEAFTELWAQLVAKQKKRGRRKPLSVLALHVVSSRIWGEDKSQPLIILQKEFCNYGGQIERIIIETEETRVARSQTLDFLREMKVTGLRSYWLQINGEKRKKINAEQKNVLEVDAKDLLIQEHLGWVTFWNVDRFNRKIKSTDTYATLGHPNGQKILKEKLSQYNRVLTLVRKLHGLGLGDVDLSGVQLPDDERQDAEKMAKAQNELFVENIG